jgi:hypothetical protein
VFAHIGRGFIGTSCSFTLLFQEFIMTKQSGGANKQSSTDSGAKQSADTPKAKSGKDAGSHTKADKGKGAGGGAKQARKH